jgi:protein-tyrosine phosphatase
MKILMVCLGNICRSPLAEGILRDKIRKAGLHWTVDSAGTANYHIGDSPHHLSQKVAKLNGVDISYLQGRQFDKHDILHFDKIYVMDANNYEEVKNMSRELWDEKKVDLLLNELYPFENREVPDPWYGSEEGYHRVYQMISEACDAILTKYAHTPLN